MRSKVYDSATLCMQHVALPRFMIDLGVGWRSGVEVNGEELCIFECVQAVSLLYNLPQAYTATEERHVLTNSCQ